MNGKTVKYLFEYPERSFSMLGSKGLLNWVPDKAYIKIQFRLDKGVWPDLRNPKTFNEKLQWMKLYDRNPLYTTLVDKYAVRRYIADKIGEEYLIPLVGGPWNSAEEIDFDSLPEQFVLKCNHDSGGVIICRDKSSFDRATAARRLDEDLKKNYYLEGREWPYKNVKPCIIAEKYMEDENGELRDYKFYCFNGIPRYSLITTDRILPDMPTCYTYFDMDFNMLPFYNSGPHAREPLKKPENYERMRELAQLLSRDMLHLRVDFYQIRGRIYLGELTFFDSSGMARFDPPEWDEKIGAWLKLPERENK